MIANGVPPAPGAYFVEGSYTFTAATGAETSPVNCYIQDWDEASGRWVNGRWIEGGSYTHDVSRSAAKIRLTWRKGRTFKILIR